MDLTRAPSEKGTPFLSLCDHFYMVPPLALDTLSMAYHKTTIQEGDPFDHFMEKPLAVTWVLEMRHYVNDWKDIVPVHIPGTTGWDAAASYNYALFAAAMYYLYWHWSTGKAKTKPEEEMGYYVTPE